MQLEIFLPVEVLDANGEHLTEREVCVSATYTNERGSRDRYGVPMEPDFESMEIDTVTDENGEDVELDAQDTERARDMLFEKLRDLADSWPED